MVSDLVSSTLPRDTGKLLISFGLPEAFRGLRQAADFTEFAEGVSGILRGEYRRFKAVWISKSGVVPAWAGTNSGCSDHVLETRARRPEGEKLCWPGPDRAFLIPA